MALKVAEELGGYSVLHRNVTSEVELADVVRHGLPVGSLDHVLGELTPSVASQLDVYRVVGSARTLQRKRSTGKPLSAEESDRLARLVRLVVRAQEALGDRDTANRWLGKANRALGGRIPLHLLDSDAGALAVERVLGRIEHGVYS
ncbi:MAG: type II RES/Xre toxin-antitoxin system antitoxin [Gemmatimonadales bacterium]